MKSVAILGTRGIPARHGGFETFAEHLALFLVPRGWQVSVYCQDEGIGAIWEEEWKGIRLVHIPVRSTSSALATVVFDWRSTLHAAREPGLKLTLGYNTAVFCLWYRLKGLKNLINMDGIEWRRGKWGLAARTWLYGNERFGCWLGNHLIADHPEIKRHLSTRVAESKITMIPYGADKVVDADASLLNKYGLAPKAYALVIARPEPENSILEIVSAFSSKQRGYKLAVLGDHRPEEKSYDRKVMEAAGSEVAFLGSIYQPAIVQALRFHCRLYIHGHQVGGTNPSLVEALGSGSAVLAYDNVFNRWVTGSEACYFTDSNECALLLDELLTNEVRLTRMRKASLGRFEEAFVWDQILKAYEALLEKWVKH